jgi:hypothetical protein
LLGLLACVCTGTTGKWQVNFFYAAATTVATQIGKTHGLICLYHHVHGSLMLLGRVWTCDLGHGGLALCGARTLKFQGFLDHLLKALKLIDGGHCVCYRGTGKLPFNFFGT